MGNKHFPLKKATGDVFKDFMRFREKDPSLKAHDAQLMNNIRDEETDSLPRFFNGDRMDNTHKLRRGRRYETNLVLDREPA